MIDFLRITGFYWGAENCRKKDCEHGVSQAEVELAFFNDPLLVVPDMNSSTEKIWLHALGCTDDARLLHMTFTLRDAGTLIRVISARDMSRKERTRYAKET